MRRVAAAAVVLLVVAVALPVKAWRSVYPPLTIEESAERAAVIFEGEVVAVQAAGRVELRVLTVYKGEPPSRIVVRSLARRWRFSRRRDVGRRYLVFAREWRGGYRFCGLVGERQRPGDHRPSFADAVTRLAQLGYRPR